MEPSPASETPLRVLYLGRLSPEKGVDVLLRAWALLIHSPSSENVADNHSSPVIRHSSLTIVGDGHERPALEALAAELGISGQVEFTGALPRSAAFAMLSTASLLVFPSVWYEQFAITPIEAMSLGVPILVSDVARFGTIVENGVTGRFFPPGSPAALATAIRELLSDPTGLRRMGEAARTAFEASDCVPSRNLKRLLDIYNV